MKEDAINSQEFQRVEGELRALLNKSRDLSLSPSPYLSTRVMARVQERSANRRAAQLWKRIGFSFGGLSLALGLCLFIVLSSPATYQGLVERAMLVKVEVTDMGLEDISYAEVVLPPQIEFYSKKFPNLALQRSLRVQWTDKLGEVPFVIRGLNKGKHAVVIKFFNQSGDIVATRKIAIKFVEENSAT